VEGGPKAALFILSEPKLSRTRLFIIFSFFLAVLLCLIVRLGFIQIFKSSRYLSLQENQSRAVVEMPPARGRVLDSKGNEMALDVRLDSLYSVSREVKDKAAVADKLSKILGTDRKVLLEKLSRDKMFVWLARKISASQTDAIKRLKINGLAFVKESQRVYPKQETACHLVGFTDIDNNGLEGIELVYNSFLKGVPGWRMVQKDAKQRELISKQLELVPPVDGYNIHLTIDEVVQSIAERALAATCKKRNALGGSIVVLDPKSGDVLAMAMYPLYDLNNARNSKPEHRRNRAVTDLFEPGSVFKVFTLSGIVQEKVMSLEDKLNCEGGTWAVAGKVLHDVHAYGMLSLREIMEKSSNIGTVKAAMKLGAVKVHKYIRDFGFGSRTGIGLAGEISGIVPNPKNWSRSSIINIPIGQGVAVTPIQLASAFAAIANNGVLMKPRILTHIADSDGKIIQSFDPEPVRQVISKETAMQVRTVMEGVVSRGTGKKAAVPGFRAAGKTGTAQKLLPNGQYSHDHFWASFVGFVPYDEPKIVVAVSIDEPHPVYYGGEVAAPAFSTVASEILAYWRISQTQLPAQTVRNGVKLKKMPSKPAESVSPVVKAAQ